MHKILKTTLIAIQLIIPQHLVGAADTDRTGDTLRQNPTAREGIIDSSLMNAIHEHSILKNRISVTLLVSGMTLTRDIIKDRPIFEQDDITCRFFPTVPIDLSVEEIQSGNGEYYELIDDCRGLFVSKFAAVIAYLHANYCTFDFSKNKLRFTFNPATTNCQRPSYLTVILPEYKEFSSIYGENISMAITDIISLINKFHSIEQRDIFIGHYFEYLDSFNKKAHEMIKDAYIASTTDAHLEPVSAAT